jgi:uncharacterized linocin/CFP29 family protein
MPNDPQVPWTEEQWARVNQVIQEEAGRARVAASFLPLSGPLPPDTDFVRAEIIPPDAPLTIQDRDTIQLVTLQVRVPVRSAQIADPELASTLALFRRAANVIARLEDAVVFRGLLQRAAVGPAEAAADAAATAAAGTAEALLAAAGATPEVAAAAGAGAAAAAAAAAPPPRRPFEPPGGTPPPMWEIQGGQAMPGLWAAGPNAPWPWMTPPFRAPDPWQWVSAAATQNIAPGDALVRAVSDAIGNLEARGHFGPFAAVLGQGLFLVAQTPTPGGSLVLPQDRIIPFLGGGPLLRSSTIDTNGGVVVALGGAPVELVIATDVSLQFLQITAAPDFLFRVREKIALRIKQADSIVRLYLPPTVTAVNPNSGRAAGGPPIVIAGTNFVGVREVWFGRFPAPGFNRDSDTQITVPLPAGARGRVFVRVITDSGTGPDRDTLANRFTYN